MGRGSVVPGQSVDFPHAYRKHQAKEEREKGVEEGDSADA